MGLFNRRRADTAERADARAGIEAFWQWWAVTAAEIADAVPAGRLDRYVDVVTRRVHAIDPGLAWEFGPGVHSEHQLTVTA